MTFTQPVDIGNQTLQLLGQAKILSLTQNNKSANAINRCYDNVRRQELERNVWRFATRRARIRPVTVSMQLYAPLAWAIGTTYAAFNVASYAGYSWILGVASSTGEQPDQTAHWQHYFGPMTADIWDSSTTYDVGELAIVPAAYAGGTAYAAGDIVSSGGLYYVSLSAGNIGHTPASSATYWVLWTNTNTTRITYPGSPTVAMATVNGTALDPSTADWATLTGTIARLIVLWPLGAGPLTDTASRNVYVLPVGFLREAPQDPKSGANPFLGAPHGRQRDDFVFEGNYLVTRQFNPMVLRFCADVWDVTAMNPMFCMGLAASIALITCEEITSSREKMGEIQTAYDRIMGEARTVNGIQTGTVEPPEDDFVTCRI